MKLSQPTRILLALIIGLAVGIVAMSTGQAWTEGAANIAEPIGGLWLNALQMTIVPLVVSLIITGIAGAAEAARASRLATRALMLFAALLLASSILAAILTPALLNLFPLPGDSAASFTANINDTTKATTSGAFTNVEENGCHLYQGYDKTFARPFLVGPNEGFVFELLSTVSGTVHLSGGVEAEELGG